MKIFDPHVHMTSRTTDDYEAMAAAGVVAIVEPAFWLGQPRTSAASFIDYFEETLPIVLASGCWAGHTIYPHTEMDEARMASLVEKYRSDRIIVNSAADWGISDPLKVPKTIDVMRARGIPDSTIQTIVWDNPVAFFAQSGQLDLAEIGERPVVDRAQKFETNTVLRGDSGQSGR